MNTYVELKGKEKQLLEKIEKIRKENLELLSELDEYKEKYEEDFTVIAKDLKNSEPKKIIYRLIVLQDDVKMSNNINEQDKKQISDLIDKIGEKVTYKDDEYKEVISDISNNRNELEQRKEYLIDINEKIKDKENKIKILEKKEVYYEAIISNKFSEQPIIEEAKRILTRVEEEKEMVELEISTILEEPGLKEDFELIKKELNSEIQKESNEKSKKNKKEKTAKVDKNNEIKEEKTFEEETKKGTKIENVAKAIENKLELESEEKVREKDLEAVTPEKPHRVMFKKKASPELINKIKGSGKKVLGILAIGAAVAVIITNPLALVVIPATKLLSEQAKEHIKKK